MRPIRVAEPVLDGNERTYVNDCLDDNWVSSNGKYNRLLEDAFAKFCGTRHAIAVNNGTSALHLAMLALGIGPGDEVLIPTVTYIATANAVRYCGATPVLVDSEPDTLNIDPAAIAAKVTPRTRGIIPVHLYGHPADMDAINDIAAAHGLWVVEDAAEAHGATVRGRTVGSLSACATFSFFGNKIVTTGEGGMITTDDDELAASIRLFGGQGMDPKRRYWFPVVGYNYRMTNVQAALGFAQMESVEDKLAARRRVASWYDAHLADLADALVLPSVAPWADHVYWMYTVYLRSGGEPERDAVMASLAAADIETRPVFYPMHLLPPYAEKTTYPVADVWAGRGMNLPTHANLVEEDVVRVASALRTALTG